MKVQELVNKFQGELKISPFHILKVLSQIEEKDISFYLINTNLEIRESSVRNILKHFKEGYPIEYITNKVKFMGNEFYVNENVLIPRIETEDLVIFAINLIKEEKIKNVLDIGTGSGAIAISIKKNINDINVKASDISSEAINIAKYNAKKLGANVEFKTGAYLDPFLEELNEIELIVSNPPYVETDFIDSNTSLKYEPYIALNGGNDGQNFFRVMTKKYSNLLINKYLIFESSEFSINKTAMILSNIGVPKIIPDSFGKERFIFVSPD
jgi:release factor glutamine methyltransferase